MSQQDGFREFWNAIRSVKLRPYDYVILAVAALVVSLFSVYAVGRGGPAQSVEIRSDEGDFVYPLNQDRHIHVEGPLGHSDIVIENGAVRFLDSPCRDKICVAAGELSRSGEWAACLPNRVFVSVTGTQPDESPIDATAF